MTQGVLISAGVWVWATHSVTQLYGADGAEGFSLFVTKVISKCFALVSFDYEPLCHHLTMDVGNVHLHSYVGNQRRSCQDIAQFGLTPGLKHVKAR